MSVEQIIQEVQGRRTQRSVNVKEENLVMKELLNDRSFKAAVYGKDGVEDYICPAEEMDSMVGGIISKTTGISQPEAEKLAIEYEYTKNDAGHMINVSKEFVNTYMDTGRKMSLGKRKDSDISIAQKEVPARMRHVSKKIGIDEKGEDIRETIYVDVKEHKSIRVISK